MRCGSPPTIWPMDYHDLPGWFVVEVGRRQAWPFVTFADPASGDEARLYIDAMFRVGSTDVVDRDEDAAIVALLQLEGLTVQRVHRDGAAITLHFDDTSLSLSGTADARTSGDTSWLTVQHSPAT